MRKCNNCGAKVSFRVCTQCLRETVKGLEAELKQSNEQFEVMPAGKDRNMVDERIELITAHIKFRQELDDKISKSAMEAESEMAEIQKLKNIRNIAKEDADLTKSQLEATKVRLNLLKQSEPVDEGQLHRVLLESVRLSKKTADDAIYARKTAADLVVGEAKYSKDNDMRRFAIEKLESNWHAHIDKMEHSFNMRYVYTIEQLRDKCKTLEKKFTELRAAFDAEKDSHKKRIPEIEAAYQNWMDGKEAELASLGDELEKLEAPDIAGRKEMEAKSLKIAEEMEVRKISIQREIMCGEISIKQNALVLEQCRIEWHETCESLKKLEERERQGREQRD